MKAKKLPSGSWRCQVYSHTEEIPQPDGTVKKKRIYKSFTNDNPTANGKRECEKTAAMWAASKENEQRIHGMTFGEALEKYIEQRSPSLSPATIREYKRVRNVCLQSLMDITLKEITQEQIQIAINIEAQKLSPKTVRNYHGLVSAVIGVYRPDFVIRTVLPKEKYVRTFISRLTAISSV